MAEKSFLEKFNKYEPTDTEIIRVLSRVYNYTVRLSKEQRLIECDVHFDDIVDKSLLYRIENEIKAAYSLNFMKILPKYHESLFGSQYFEQILLEAERVGIVAKGFFSGCDWEISGESITITIPFQEGGVRLLENANTHKIIENIIFSEFGRKFTVKIISNGGASTSAYEKRKSEELKYDREIAEQSKR